MSGKGGDIIINVAKQVLDNEFPEYKHINLTTPDEYTRRRTINRGGLFTKFRIRGIVL